MSRRAGLAGMLAAVAALAAASGAAASWPSPAPVQLATASPVIVPHTGPLEAFSFKNRDGYTVTVTAFQQTVALSVAHVGHSHSSGHANSLNQTVPTTTYLVHGRVTPTSIRASLAERGQIAVRFRAHGPALRARRGSHCAARNGVIARLGSFVGEISFEGEGGYTSAHVHHARGATIDIGALFSCALATTPPSRHAARATRTLLGTDVPSTGTHPSAGPKSTILLADRKLPLARTSFAAEESDPGPALFVAIDERSEGSIAIVHHALVLAPRAAFSFEDSLGLAAVSPPAPFSGTATFAVGPEGTKTWTGSLSISFPGAPDVPLAGPPFSTELVRRW